jgi:hypothetical protein
VVRGGGDSDGDGLDDILAGGTRYLNSFARDVVRTALIPGAMLAQAEDGVVLPDASVGPAVLVGSEVSGMGADLAFIDDVDGDGASELLLGAPGMGVSGQVYLVRSTQMSALASPLEGIRVTSSGGTGADAAWWGDEVGLGHRVEGADVDGDGTSEVLATEYLNSAGGLESGVVHVLQARLWSP